MISTQDLADALVAWARETCPELVTGYAHPHAEKTGPFPDVAAEVQRTRLVREDLEGFPFLGVEQISYLRAHDFDLLLLVDPDDAAGATQVLEECVDKLTASMLEDPTLGGRVPVVSPLSETSYDPPFVEFDDGTRGRIATMTLTVGDPVDAED